MTGQFAEPGLPFYVDCAVKAWSNERKVNAQSAREVGIRQRCFVPPGMAQSGGNAPNDFGLGACCSFARTLFECQAVRILQGIDSRPRWHFGAQLLPAFGLLEHVGGIHVGAFGQ